MAKAKAAAASKEPKKIVDIAHPNISAPSETSKPIIVTNRSVMRDPMMTPPVEAKPTSTTVESATESTPANPAPAIVKRQKMILPPGVAPTPDAPVANTSTVPQPEPNFTLSESIAETTVDDTPTVEPLTPAAAEAQAESDEDAKRLKLDKLVETEEYFLPVDTVELRKVKQFVVLGVVLIIVLGLAWFDIALDANLIQIEGLEAPTNFFSN